MSLGARSLNLPIPVEGEFEMVWFANVYIPWLGWCKGSVNQRQDAVAQNTKSHASCPMPHASKETDRD
jgi:hypothetical protein